MQLDDELRAVIDEEMLGNLYRFLLVISIAVHRCLDRYSIGLTLLCFKMAMMPLVPEIKIADVGRIISLGNLLVRKMS